MTRRRRGRGAPRRPESDEERAARLAALQDDRIQRVLATVDSIPHGRVASYGQVAEEAGFPRGARFVGSVLKRFVNGRDVPWHRVLGSDGTVRVTGGIARDQVRLLRAEGVEVVRGRVRLTECGWDPSQ